MFGQCLWQSRSKGLRQNGKQGLGQCLRHILNLSGNPALGRCLRQSLRKGLSLSV